MSSQNPRPVVLAPCGECPEDQCDRCQNCRRLEQLPAVIKRIGVVKPRA